MTITVQLTIQFIGAILIIVSSFLKAPVDLFKLGLGLFALGYALPG